MTNLELIKKGNPIALADKLRLNNSNLSVEKSKQIANNMIKRYKLSKENIEDS